MEIKNNPIGNAVDVLQDKVQEVIDSWKANEANRKEWFKQFKSRWVAAVTYIVKATDYFILAVDSLVEAKPDRKATVLAAMAQVYDAIVAPILPIFIKPFNSKIKDFIFTVILSLLIDFMVSKYRTGEWVPAEKKSFV